MSVANDDEWRLFLTQLSFPCHNMQLYNVFLNKRVLLVIFEIGTYVTRAHHITEDDTGLP